MTKMRLLTFLQMSENRTEIDFPTIQHELQLPKEEIEAFIIEGMFLIDISFDSVLVILYSKRSTVVKW
jgi:hypothetical protein